MGINASTVSTSLDYKVRSLNGNEYPQATGGEDDDFNDGSFSGWTTVEAQTLTITESMGRASAIHPGGGMMQTSPVV